MKKVAIFDIDGTLFRSSLLIEMVEEMISSGLMNEDSRNKYKKELELWNKRQGSYELYIDKIVKVFEKNLKGIYYGDFVDVAKIVTSKNKHKVYKYTRDLIKSLKKDGYYLLAISHSPKTILDLFCKEYKFDKIYGRIYEIGPEDKFTGKTTDLHLIENKANILKRAVEKENLTLKDSVGVGDTQGDITFLELVQNPVCFNPNKKLYKQAKIRKWEVVVERKDVIYYIE